MKYVRCRVKLHFALLHVLEVDYYRKSLWLSCLQWFHGCDSSVIPMWNVCVALHVHLFTLMVSHIPVEIPSLLGPKLSSEWHHIVSNVVSSKEITFPFWTLLCWFVVTKPLGSTAENWWPLDVKIRGNFRWISEDFGGFRWMSERPALRLAQTRCEKFDHARWSSSSKCLRNRWSSVPHPSQCHVPSISV